MPRAFFLNKKSHAETWLKLNAKKVKIMKNEIVIQPAQTTPSTLLEKAIEKGADIAQLKELMDLQERWEKKEAKKAFFDALSLFQTKVPLLKKSKTANIKSDKGSFSYRYSDLGSITNTIKHILLECGLSYRWEFKEEGGKMTVTCLVSHRDGHTETTFMEAGLDSSGSKNAIQQKGSTHTYLQRYTLIGALGLSTADEDNDGKSHSKAEQKEMSEDEILDQWQQAVNQVKSRIELTGLYLKNRKAVDGNDKVKAIFKARESKLPETKKTELV